ncbi:hypothetical protein ACIBM3_32990 [Rhodococcus erythropolis]|uniref:hypothetical protein n=1 Tax=Rhodococcus erythropolis TaxID=1833 RepID=UPI0037B59D0D
MSVLLDKLDKRSDRDWYASTAADHGWSRNVMQNQINGGLRRRIDAALSNFQDHLPAEDSNLAQQLVRDPYVFDLLDITERVAERELESANGIPRPIRHTESQDGPYVQSMWTDSMESK